MKPYSPSSKAVGSTTGTSGTRKSKARRQGKHDHRKELPILFDAIPGCVHRLVDAPGGGLKCTKCPGWFCY